MEDIGNISSFDVVGVQDVVDKWKDIKGRDYIPEEEQLEYIKAFRHVFLLLCMQIDSSQISCIEDLPKDLQCCGHVWQRCTQNRGKGGIKTVLNGEPVSLSTFNQYLQAQNKKSFYVCEKRRNEIKDELKKFS